MNRKTWWNATLWMLAAVFALGFTAPAMADEEKAGEPKPAAEIKKDEAKPAEAEKSKDEKKDDVRATPAARAQRGSFTRMGAMGAKFWEREGVKEQLKLTDEQIKKLNEGFAATEKEIAALSEQMRENWQARRALGENPDEAKKAELDKKTQELRDKMEVLQGKREAVVKDVLNDDQEKALAKWQSEIRNRARSEGRATRGNRNAPDQEQPKADDSKPKAEEESTK